MERRGVLFLFCSASLFVGGFVHAEDSVDELLKAAATALKEGKSDEALRLAGRAVESDGKGMKARRFRGLLHEELQKHAEAVADFDKILAADPTLAALYDHRGSEKFKLGDFAGSLADFDKYLELAPQARAGHWKRGITCYYAGKFEDGAKQFKGYETVDTNDVENAVWHFLCVARKEGVEKARAGILTIGNDRRVPMSQVYALFAGKAKTDDVLAAVREGKPGEEELNRRLFYAHLYLGLYAEAQGDRKKAREHLTESAKHDIGHYMWDVARVHRDLLVKD